MVIRGRPYRSWPRSVIEVQPVKRRSVVPLMLSRREIEGQVQMTAERPESSGVEGGDGTDVAGDRANGHVLEAPATRLVDRGVEQVAPDALVPG